MINIKKNNKTKKILFLSGTRADFGKIKSFIETYPLLLLILISPPDSLPPILIIDLFVISRFI